MNRFIPVIKNTIFVIDISYINDMILVQEVYYSDIDKKLTMIVCQWFHNKYRVSFENINHFHHVQDNQFSNAIMEMLDDFFHNMDLSYHTNDMYCNVYYIPPTIKILIRSIPE